MGLIPAATTITELRTVLDRGPMPSAGGKVIWADISIDFALSGMCPNISVRVPVPWSDSDSSEGRKEYALRLAREFFERACGALPAPHSALSREDAQVAAETAMPGLADFVRELGLTPSTDLPQGRRQPAKSHRRGPSAAVNVLSSAKV